MAIHRRAFLGRLGRGLALGVTGLACRPACRTVAERERDRDGALKTRGVVLIPEDLSLADWPARARRAGLTTIGIHHQSSPQAVVRWVEAEAGGKFLEDCRKLGLEVEYELHAMKELLPRELFAKDPGLFRMDDGGDRSSDANCCVHSARALEIIAENASTIAGSLRPTTGRYFFWGDDGQPWCRCPKCRELSEPEQALVLENSLLAALRRLDPGAQLAHLAYANTLRPPAKIRPDPGVFLEYAPIARRYDIPYAMQRGAADKDGLQALEANLQVFPSGTAQVLEYWLDASRFSQWKRPAVRIPWNRQVFLADVRTYVALGIHHVTTFAAWVDADYVKRFGEPVFLDEYGAGLVAE
jgi:hypothetical protein